MLAVEHLHAGFNAVGVDTVDLGIVPVGAVSRLGQRCWRSVRRYGQRVPQSRPPTTESNSSGQMERSLSDEREAVHRGIVFVGDRPWPRPAGCSRLGSNRSMSDAVDRYLHRVIVRRFPVSNSAGCPSSLDCANGAALTAAPRAVRRTLELKIEVFAAEPDGMNINDGCGATHPEYLVGPRCRQRSALRSTETPTGSLPSTKMGCRPMATCSWRYSPGT